MMNQTAGHHVERKLHNFPAQAFINGQWVDANSSKKFKVKYSILSLIARFNYVSLFIVQVVDPASNELLGEVADCDSSDVNKAVNAAHTAFDSWRNQTAEVTNFSINSHNLLIF